ncbi:unnamed protein product [Clonostachys rosea]|uniref:Alcohol dehydrogenase-like C-terminal domain-containing protein n=1 Tax=Bionectria ochroleuca TaxID=29856 RepID=A0ABY6UFM7_BIOOC|nr:unnamed protein product [Clonostachys rosea]
MTLEMRPRLTAGPGSVVVRILAVSVRANAPRVWQDPASGHPLPTPCVPGFASLGRVAEVGPDATVLESGQLVFFDPHIVGRDSTDAVYISGFMEGFNAESRRLSRCEWRDSTLAEFARLPLENCHPLNEQRLLGDIKDGGLGYSLDDLTHLFSMLIPFGGLADIDVKAGDTAVIAPATGRYGSAAVHVALAMGARVIAIGRNATVLKQLNDIDPGRLSTVQMTGDVIRDTEVLRATAGGQGVSAFWDMSPPGAATSTHFTSVLNVLNRGARISLMGSVSPGVSFDYMQIMVRALAIKGTWMSTKEQTRRLLGMVETGVLPLGARAKMGAIKKFNLQDWGEALATAAAEIEPGEVVVMP